ncbi:MAG: sugar transferase [Actinobacteria bacterium]|nr:sugar transferase [Actinomycetota bacterium]
MRQSLRIVRGNQQSGHPVADHGGRVEDAVRLDLDYVENWSLLRDVMIIAKTVKTVLTADGAY